MGTLMQDLRLGLRMMRSRPGFTAAAVAVLGLGIGANSAILSLVNAFLFKPLAVHKPEELVGCFSRNTRTREYRSFSYPNYADLRERNTVFSIVMAHNLAMVGLTEGETTRRVFADIVTANSFATFGTPLFRGRAFTLAEERPGSRLPVVIVSHSLWKRTGADPHILGKPMRINGHLFTIVGIAPEGFTGTTAVVSPELFLPLGMYESVINGFEGRGRKLADRNYSGLIVVGRLRPGLSLQAANGQLAPLAAQLETAFPAENKEQSFSVHPLSRLAISTSPTDDRQLLVPAALLLSMAAVVLLIASLNVANMMLARGAVRRKEIAIRLALGGGRRAIMRQLSTEGLLLALPGGAAGLALAYWSTTLLIKSMSRLAPLDLVYHAGPDVRVLAATIGLCLLSTMVFGLWPAWNLSRPNLVTDLKEGDHDLPGGKRRRLLSRRNLLVIAQVSLSLMLLTAAGLFMRSASRTAGVQPGFRMEGVAVVEVDASLAGYDEARGRQVYQALVERLRATPGITSAALGATIPFGIVSLGRTIERAGDPHPSPAALSCQFNVAGDRYFETMGIPLLRGRTFVAADAARTSRVAILDQAAAGRLWPDGSAVGRHIRMVTGGSGGTRDAEVVGIVGSVKESMSEGHPQPHVYVAYGQEYQANTHIYLSTGAAGRDNEAHLLETIRREVRAVDARLPVLALKTMRQHLDASFDLWIVRTGARMFAIFGGVALLLATIGLYGVRAYTVACRTREIGIRMALGAGAGDALRLILREGLMVTAVGAGAGLALSLALGKFLSSFLYEVSGVDALVFTTAPLLLAAVSLVACYLPARRAARVDPMVALRSE
jgi:predicted permease